MKFLYLIIIAACIVQLGHAQNGILRLFDQSRQEAGVFLDIVNDNDTLIFYRTERDSLNRQGIGFYKIDTFGHVLNKRLMVDTARLFSSSSWARKGIIKTSDGHYVMTGTTNAEIGSSIGAPYFVKLDKDLNIVSRVIYSSVWFTRNASLIEDNSGFLLLTSVRQPNSSLALDILIIKTDMEGNELWRKQYGDYEFTEAGLSIVKTESNEFIIHGNISDYPDFDDPHWPEPTWGFGYMMAIDSNGDKLWEQEVDTTGLLRILHQALPTENGGWICRGATWEQIVYPEINLVDYFSRPMLYGLDESMNVTWERIFGVAALSDVISDLNRTIDGHYLASGVLYDSLVDIDAYYGTHYKFSVDGDSIWMRRDTIYSRGIMRVNASEILSSGSIISIGWDDSGPYGQTGFIMKMTKDGCVDTIGCFPVSAIDLARPDLEVLNFYPNPAYDEITIDLPSQLSGDEVHILIHDMQGRVVIQEHQQAFGAAQLIIDVSSLAAGSYLVEVRSRRQRWMGRMLKVE